MERLVYEQRNKDFGDWEAIIMSPPLIIANPTSGSLFLLFNASVQIEDRNGIPALKNFIGLGHPELVHELRQGPLNMFVDCTFKTVPGGFYQLFILMAYLPSYATYVPIFYVLMQSKKYNAYKYVLSNLVFQTDWKLISKTITCDFEVALLKSIHEEFSGEDVDITCCEFHWK